MSRSNNAWTIATACLIPNVGGWINGLVLMAGSRAGARSRHPSPDPDYHVAIPDWAPPDWLSVPIWIYLYTSIGYASYLVWRDGEGFRGLAKYPLYVYVVQLIINWLYPPIYFGIKNVKWGFLDLFSLCVIAGLCGLMFYSINRIAGALFIPYLAWLIFVTVLNYHIWQNNKKFKQSLH